MADSFAQWRAQQKKSAAGSRRWAAEAKRAARSAGRGARGAGKVFKARGGRASTGKSSYARRGKTPGKILYLHKGGLAGDAYSERDPSSELVWTNMLGASARERAEEFAQDELRRPDLVRDNFYVHCSISSPAGRDLSRQEWAELARQFLLEVQAEGCQAVVIRHRPTAKKREDHIHITFSRLRPDGRLVNDSFSRWRWRAGLHRAQEKLGLPLEVERAERPEAATTRAVSAQRLADRKGQPARVWVRPEALREALAASTSHDQLVSELGKRGIEMKVATSTNGDATGVLFKNQPSETWLAGSSIGEFSHARVEAALAANHTQELQRQATAHLQQRQVQDQHAAQRRNRYPVERG